MDWSCIRSLFPVTQELAYFNHAGVAPISSRVAEALERYARASAEFGAFHYPAVYDAEIERVRGQIAQLIGAASDEIAFTKNTTEGLGFVANGLAWNRGDRVVTCDLEYPSNVYPWWHLERAGIETVMLASRDGILPLDAVATALEDPKVRLLTLSSVEFGSGARNDLAALGALCKERGVLFCVDGIQSLGCIPLEVESCGIDFLATDGHKWMLSVEGCGFFYASKRVLDRLTPQVVGWRSVTDNHDFDRYHLDLQPGAGKFEEGTPNTAGIFALGAATDLLLELGVDSIWERVLELTNQLTEGLERRGFEVKSPRGPHASGIVSFAVPGESPKRTVARLRSRNIFVVERRGGVRASPHFYNDDGEIDALLTALEDR